MQTDRKRKVPPTVDQTKNLSEILKETSKEILSAKEKNDSVDNLRKLITKSSLLFLELKQANRETFTEVENKKVDHQKEKVKLDQLNLQLQNLLYEKAHLKREIQACKDFK